MTKDKNSTLGQDAVKRIAVHLDVMRYQLTAHGAGVARQEYQSGYNAVEVASHIALATMAMDVRRAGTDAFTVTAIAAHATALIEVLREYKDNGMMNPMQWQADSTAILRISSIDDAQQAWIDSVLSDPIAGDERLANSQVDYSRVQPDENAR